MTNLSHMRRSDCNLPLRIMSSCLLMINAKSLMRRLKSINFRHQVTIKPGIQCCNISFQTNKLRNKTLADTATNL